MQQPVDFRDGGTKPIKQLDGAMATMGGANGYQAVAAGQNAQALGAAGGKIHDYIERLVVTVNASGATATLSIQDGANSAITLSPTGGFGATGLVVVQLGVLSQDGGWKITTGAGLQVLAVGSFS